MSFDYFTSIGNDFGSKFNKYNEAKCPCNSACSDQYDHIRTVNKLKFSAISADFVLDQICNMQNSKSPWLDKFNVKLLKLAGPYISNCLAHTNKCICNLSLGESTSPDEWKKAKVTPIFKAGDKTDVGNHRPISVLPIISKIIERAIQDQLYAGLAF